MIANTIIFQFHIFLSFILKENFFFYLPDEMSGEITGAADNFVTVIHATSITCQGEASNIERERPP
jgi:hypothetical protein